MEKITRLVSLRHWQSSVQRFGDREAAWTARKTWNPLVAALPYAEHEIP